MIWLTLILGGIVAFAQTPSHEAIWDTKAKKWLSVSELAITTSTGQIIVFGEEHAFEDNMNDLSIQIHHANQRRFLDSVLVPVSLGMEFLPYTEQASTDSFFSGGLEQTEFQSKVGWTDKGFDLYLEVMNYTKKPEAKVIALNIPRAISAQVAKGGPQSLSSEQLALTPPRWEKGSETYFERFRSMMEGHVSEGKILDYFWAQSLWDDTMAWQATEFIHANPGQALVIIVGSFHAQFSDGLPLRLIKHGASSVKVMLQAEVTSWTTSELNKAIAPDPVYGEQADYIWVWRR